MKKNFIFHLNSIFFVCHNQELSYDFHSNVIVFFDEGEILDLQPPWDPFNGGLIDFTIHPTNKKL